MRITSVKAVLLSYPLPEPLKLAYHGGERTILKRDAMFIRIETASGVVGYAPGEGSEKAKATIDEIIGPFLTGRKLADPDALRVQFMAGPGRDANAAKVYCAVEIALYDALGKALGAPVSELLGGRIRDRIRLYGSAGMYSSPEQYAEEAAAIVALGFRAYKMRAGTGPEKDVEAVRRTRSVVGPDLDLMVNADAWWRMGDRNYARPTVDSIAAQMAEYRIAWLEEPLPPEDHDAYRRLKELDLVPIAAGEHEPDEPRLLDLILTGAVDYAQIDIVRQGGYPMAKRILPSVAGEGLRFAFHSWGTALEVIAAAHFGVCWPESVVEWLEYPCYSGPSRAGMYPFPLAAEILKDPLEIAQGDLVVPRNPGLGVEVDESVAERYPWIPGPWSSFDIAEPSGK